MDVFATYSDNQTSQEFQLLHDGGGKLSGILGLYYLDGDTWRMHDFNGFVPADSAARTGMDSDLGYNPSSLGHYLRRGDRLTKAAHSPELTTRRGSTTTHWILYAFTPEGMRPSPEKPPVWEDEDSIHIP